MCRCRSVTVAASPGASETLIYGTEVELENAADFRVGRYHIYCRPFLAQFLCGVDQWYELGVWSSAVSDYVTAVAHAVCPAGITWRFVWGRERCVRRVHSRSPHPIHLKDIRKIKRRGFDIHRTLIVDDSPIKLSRNYGNAIHISPFTGARNDCELLLLLAYVSSIRDVDNYRQLEKRNWKTAAWPVPQLKST